MKKLIAILIGFLCLSSIVMAQSKTVTGIVLDDKGETIIGARVMEEGTTNGAATNIDGEFTITVKDENAVLTISYVGMKTQSVSVKGKTNVEIVLTDDAALLDEVVVVGYGTSRRRDLTGSISSLRPDKDNAALATSVDDLLQGKIAGVNISSGGSTPGAAGSVLIRGANSLTGDSQPLYVIDNVPQSSTGQIMSSASGDYQMAQDPLAGINPNDIEDIQVLKDASATAIYGSRGANGVIIITTKKGVSGKTKINASAKTTIAQAAKLLPIMNLNEYAQFQNAKHSTNPRFALEDGNIYYQYSTVDEDGNSVNKKNLVVYRDWQREALRTGVSQDYNLNMNGGSDKTRFNFSTGFKNVNGIIQNTGFKHGDMRLNLNTDVTDKLSFNVNLSGFIRRNTMMSGGNTVGRTTGAIIPTALNAQPFTRPADDPSISDDDKTTVMSWITDFDDITNEYKFSVATESRYQFNKNLSYTLRAGGNLGNQERVNWYGMELFKGKNNSGFLGQSLVKNSNYNVENMLNYNQTFGIVRLDATAAVTYDVYKWLNTGLDATQFPFFSMRTDGLHIAQSVEIRNPIQRDYQLLSYLGRANLSFYNGRYVLTASLRSDATSKFAKGNRRAYFPSFAAAWNVQEENFLKNANWLSQLKLRLGYGATGSQNINPYTSIFLYESGFGYATPTGDRLTGMMVKGSNPLLMWETTSSFNSGVDFGVLKNRITATIDVYTKTTKDLLLDTPVPPSTSFDKLTVNSGAISNKGVEVGINADIIRTKDLNWTLGGNIAFNKSKILAMGLPLRSFGSLGTIAAFYGSTAGDHFGVPNIFIEGEAPGLFYGFKTDGIVQEGDTYLADAPLAGSVAPGNLKVVDISDNGRVGLEDLTIIGDPNPDFTYGFQTGLNYKQLRFKTSFAGVQGGDIFNANMRYKGLAMTQNYNNNMFAEPALNAWTPENKSNIYPSTSSTIANGYIYDRYIEDGSYLRCTDITVGYSLPTTWTSKVGFSMIDVFASVKDAFTITKYSGYDPTSRSFAFDPLARGFDLWSFPAQRAIILGLNVSF